MPSTVPSTVANPYVAVGLMDNSVTLISYKGTNRRRDDLEYVSNWPRPLGDGHRERELLLFPTRLALI